MYWVDMNTPEISSCWFIVLSNLVVGKYSLLLLNTPICSTIGEKHQQKNRDHSRLENCIFSFTKLESDSVDS